MVKQRNPQLNTVEQIVCLNTGMNTASLLHDTKRYEIKGIEEAVLMIKAAIRTGKTIYIPGDYDVDGIAASAILDLALLAVGAKPVVRLPKRFSEGYGLRSEMIDEFQAGQLMITVDNGISSFDAVKKAKEKGMTVIVTDHHLPVIDEQTKKAVYPAADLIIDPNAIKDSADFNGYCGAGLAFKIAENLLGERHPLLPKLKSLAAIATIADSVPLVWENRRIVKEGLKTMLTKEGTTTGLYALLYLLDRDKYISEGNIGFKIAPTLNAPGRLRDDGSMDAFQLLVFDGPFQKAKEMAEKLLKDNTERKELLREWEEKTKYAIRESGIAEDVPIVAYIPGIPEGIIGIIAGRIAEEFHSPCFLLGDTKDPEIIKGSGRTYGDVHLKNLLDGNQKHLVKYGGHAAAAGLSLKKEKLPAFRAALKESLHGILFSAEATEDYDIKISPGEASDLMKDVLKFGPYGEGNPSIMVMIEDLTLIPVGKDYFRLISNERGIKLTAAEIEAVSFDGAAEYKKLNNPRHVTLIGIMSLNYYMGKYKNQIEYKKVFAHESVLRKSPLALALERRANGRYAE